jgi:hypothetical protein
MSLRTSFIVVEGRTVADVLATACLVPLDSMVPAEAVLSGGDLPAGAETAVAAIDGWCVIADGYGMIIGDLDGRGVVIENLSRGTRAAGFLVGGPICAFRLYADGVEQRFIVHDTRTIVEERGYPRAEEANIPMPD